jgi:hypothetical protein
MASRPVASADATGVRTSEPTTRERRVRRFI